MKHVVITGVSTGIGRAATEELLAHGYHIFGSVREETDAADLQDKLGAHFSPLVFDVTDEGAVMAAADQVAQSLNGESLTGLVNNAGIAVAGPLMHQPLAEVRRQFEVNVFGLLTVTQAFLSLLGAQSPQTSSPGRVINISSVGGKITSPFLGAYSGSKHAVESISDALRRELLVYGVDVVIIEPGAVRTELFDKAEQADTAQYAATDYAEVMRKFQRLMVTRGRAGLPPSIVARTIRQALETKHPKPRYALLNRRFTRWFLPRWLPARWLDRLIASDLGLDDQTQTANSSELKRS